MTGARRSEDPFTRCPVRRRWFARQLFGACDCDGSAARAPSCRTAPSRPAASHCGRFGEALFAH